MFTQHIHGLDLDLKVRFRFWKDLGAAKAARVEAWLRRVLCADSAMILRYSLERFIFYGKATCGFNDSATLDSMMQQLKYLGILVIK